MLYLQYIPKTGNNKIIQNMKKSLTFLAAALLISANMFAQDIDSYEVFIPEDAEDDLIEAVKPSEDKMIFNHLALGASPFNPSTIVLPNLATTLTPYVQLRLGMDWFPGVFKASIFNKGNAFDIANFAFGDAKYDIKVNGHVNFGNLKFFADVFPGKRTGFHFTFGFMADIFKGGVFGQVYTSEPFLPQSDWQTKGIVIAGKGRIQTDANGNLNLGIKNNAVKPYLGIGFGRAIRPDKRVRVLFDLGIAYYGGLRPLAYVNASDGHGGYTGEIVPMELTSADLDLMGDDYKNIDFIDAGQFPPIAEKLLSIGGVNIPGRMVDQVKSAWILNWVPYANLTIFVRIF